MVFAGYLNVGASSIGIFGYSPSAYNCGPTYSELGTFASRVSTLSNSVPITYSSGSTSTDSSITQKTASFTAVKTTAN